MALLLRQWEMIYVSTQLFSIALNHIVSNASSDYSSSIEPKLLLDLPRCIQKHLISSLFIYFGNPLNILEDLLRNNWKAKEEMCTGGKNTELYCMELPKIMLHLNYLLLSYISMTQKFCFSSLSSTTQTAKHLGKLQVNKTQFHKLNAGLEI